ncbi:hypothetical protein YC2023_022392 [Brassica napus]
METQRDVDNDGVVSDDIDMEIAYPRLSIHQILKIYPNHSSCIQQYIEEPERMGFGVRKIQQEDDCVERTRQPLMNTTVSEKQTVSESDGEDDGALVQM